MKQEFIKKRLFKEYISNHLFLNIKAYYNYLIPSNFDLDDYNNKVLEKEYFKYKIEHFSKI